MVYLSGSKQLEITIYSDNANIIITDILGRLMYQNQFSQSGKYYKTTDDLRLKSGVYIISLVSKSGIITKKMSVK